MFLAFGAGMAGNSIADFVAGAALCEPQSADLSVQVFCQMAKAWWPLASTVVGLRWFNVYVYMFHFATTRGEAEAFQM